MEETDEQRRLRDLEATVFQLRSFTTVLVAMLERELPDLHARLEEAHILLSPPDQARTPAWDPRRSKIMLQRIAEYREALPASPS